MMFPLFLQMDINGSALSSCMVFCISVKAEGEEGNRGAALCWLFFLNLCRSNLTHLCFLVIFHKVRKGCVSVISVLSQGGAHVEVQEERGECSPQKHKVM